jgi:hypothetical protein
MMFKQIIDVYSENHAKPLNTKYSVTDHVRRQYIYLTLGYKVLNFVLKGNVKWVSCVSQIST